MITIRPATLADLDAITAIYNDAIAKTTATFDTQPRTPERQRAWFDAHDAQHPILVAEAAGRVVGWASLSRWSDRAAYDGTAENSVYVREECRGQGVGRRLLEALVAAGGRAGLHTVVARITGGNAVSVHLHETLGFARVGTLREVGHKFGRWLDVDMMQLIYPEAGNRQPEEAGQ